jgi:hypothetical protein
VDHSGAAVPHDLAHGLENLLDVAGPVGAHQHLQYFRRESQLALIAEPRDKEGRELLDVLDVVTQRWDVHRAREKSQQASQIPALYAGAERDGDPDSTLTVDVCGLLQGGGQGP